MLTRLMLAVLSVLVLTAAAAQAESPGQHEKRSEKAGLSYLLFLPRDYDKADKPLPLILFLHGAGETGKNLNQVKRHGPPKIVEKKKDFPFIVVSPQAPQRGWRPQALLDDISSHYRVDPERVYLTGLSMGGFGTWSLAAAHPERFAAIAPICGGGEPRQAAKLKGLPIWVFHGAKDNTVPIARSEDMVKALKDAGNDQVKFTVYPDAGHDSWSETYDNPELYSWFLAHTKSGKAKP